MSGEIEKLFFDFLLIELILDHTPIILESVLVKLWLFGKKCA